MATENIIKAEQETVQSAAAAGAAQDAGKAETAQSENVREGVIILGRPYLFEGKEYTEIDLSGMEKLTVQDAVDAQREAYGENEVAAMMVCETTTAFACKIASKASGMPIEFFKLAPRRISRRVVAVVRAYLNPGKEDKNHVMQLEKPYLFKGNTYTEIDLNGLADLNSLNESEAENRLTRAGFIVTDTRFNYLYACVLASMATGLPEEFFTRLPMYETMKLKNAVNDADFFE